LLQDSVSWRATCRPQRLSALPPFGIPPARDDERSQRKGTGPRHLPPVTADALDERTAGLAFLTSSRGRGQRAPRPNRACPAGDTEESPPAAGGRALGERKTCGTRTPCSWPAQAAG